VVFYICRIDNIAIKTKGQTIMTMTSEWHRGQIDRASEYIKLLWAKDGSVICSLQPESNNSFIVEFEYGVNEKRTKEAEKEQNFYLIELNEPDPWKYARYHCTTAANCIRG
jgi:hypothetical protein